MIYKEYYKTIRTRMRFLVENIQSIRMFEDMIKKIGILKSRGFFYNESTNWTHLVCFLIEIISFNAYFVSISDKNS